MPSTPRRFRGNVRKEIPDAPRPRIKGKQSPANVAAKVSKPAKVEPAKTDETKNMI